MSIKVALEHRTTYRFDRPIGIGPHVIRLRPAPHTRTPIEAYTLQISPGGALPQLAAGPVRQPRRPGGLPGQVRRARHHRRTGRRPAGDQPVRLLRRAVRRALPVRVPAGPGRRPAALPGDGRRRPRAGPRRVAGRAPGRRSRGPGHGRLPRRAQRGGARRRRLLAADGARRPHPRRDAHRPDRRPAATRPGCWSRRCGTTAWLPASSPATWSSSPPTCRRWTGRRARRRTSPTCTPGPRSTSPGPAGSGSTRRRPCSPGRGTSRSPPPRTRRRARRSPGPPSGPRPRWPTPTPWSGSPRPRGPPSPTRRPSWPIWTGSASRSTSG